MKPNGRPILAHVDKERQVWAQRRFVQKVLLYNVYSVICIKNQHFDFFICCYPFFNIWLIYSPFYQQKKKKKQTHLFPPQKTKRLIWKCTWFLNDFADMLRSESSAFLHSQASNEYRFLLIWYQSSYVLTFRVCLFLQFLLKVVIKLLFLCSKFKVYFYFSSGNELRREMDRLSKVAGLS